MNELIGQNLGKYKIISRVGQGGMATVFKAHQADLNRHVAIKILPPMYAEERGFSERFRREAQAIAQLEHPHILPVYDYGQQGPYTYLVMRYIEQSRTLSHAMRQALTLRQSVEYLKQVGSALDYAHTRGIIHRDIKPGNILLSENWVFLADFGLARLMEGGGTKLTRTGTGMGTPAYMSPEQGSGRQVDGRTDVYAVGVIAYQMFTGQIPHDADTPHAIIYKRIHEPPPSLRDINPTVPPLVEETVKIALAPTPDTRYQTTGEFIRALSQAVNQSDASDVLTTIVSMPPSAPQPPEISDSMYEQPTATIPPAGQSQQSLEDQPTAPSQQPHSARQGASMPKFCSNCGLALSPGATVCHHCGTAVTQSMPLMSAPPKKSPPWLWLGVLLGTVIALCFAGSAWLLGQQLAGVTATPTWTATNVPVIIVEDTHTPEPPTHTPQPEATDTPEPAPTDTPPPTSTFTPESPPTSTPTVTPTEKRFEPIFQDDDPSGMIDRFDESTLNTDIWATFPGEGQIELVNDTLRLSSEGRNFPVVYSQGELFPPEGNFSLTLDMRYTDVSERGTGVRIGQGQIAPLGGGATQPDPDAGRMIEIWQDADNWRITVGEENEIIYEQEAPDVSDHTVTVNYIDSIYQIVVDDAEVYRTDPTSLRPDLLWFGNPTQLTGDGAWSSLAVDKIAVQPLGDDYVLEDPTPTPMPIPNGRITFATDAYGASEIGLLNLSGGTVSQLTFNPTFDWGPSISPNGTQIVYVSNFSGNPEIYTMPSGGGAATQLTFDGASDDHPVWTADGQIIFASDRTGNWDIFSMDSDGSNLLNLTNHEARDIYPTVSPDGKRIAFVSERDGTAYLYVMNRDGSGVETLVNNVADIWAPAWSPDGEEILFVSIEHSDYLQGSIYRVTADGSFIQRFISSADGLVGYPTWSPDGNYVAFSKVDAEQKGRLHVATPDGEVVGELFSLPGASIWNPSWGR